MKYWFVFITAFELNPEFHPPLVERFHGDIDDVIAYMRRDDVDIDASTFIYILGDDGKEYPNLLKDLYVR